MANAYITLANSNDSVTGHYRVIKDGYSPSIEKIGAQRFTLTGAVDNQVGPVRQTWNYTLKVYATEGVAGYDTLADLQSLFVLNDPSGTPTNVITLTDHFGESHDVYMIGNFAPKPIGLDLDGAAGVYLVQVTLVETEAM